MKGIGDAAAGGPGARTSTLGAGAPRVGAVVLAAGASTRLGRPKQLVRFRGDPLVVRAARAALGAGAGPAVVVLGAAADDVRHALGAALGPEIAAARLVPVLHAGWADGLGSSVGAGVSALLRADHALDAVLLTLADQPLVDAAALRALVGAYADHRTALQGDDGIAAAAYGGIVGVPAVFGRAHAAALLELSGRGGAGALLRAAPARALVRVPLPEAAVDVDTPADVMRLGRAARGAALPRVAAGPRS